MTTSNALKRSPHIVAAVVLAAAATTVAGFVGVPVPANAAGAPPPDQSPPPDPPPAPLLGPTVSWKPVLGGLQAHITDRSGVSSQCRYVTDNYDQGFALPANSTYDLRIVPAVPKFRDWHVTINCDNGTNTQTTTYF
jgi:hypothetical protein